MAHYDTVHAGFRHGRTTALGSTFATIVPGDDVRVQPPAGPGERAGVHPGGTRRRAAGSAERPGASGGDQHPRANVQLVDFQLAMPTGGFLVVREGVLRAWTADPEPLLALLDPTGGLLTTDPAPRSRRPSIPGGAPVTTVRPTPSIQEGRGAPGGRAAAAGPSLPAPRRSRFLEMPEPPADCAVCTAVRSGRIAEYRELAAAELAEQQAQGRARRREQRRARTARRAAAERPLRVVPDPRRDS